MNRKPSPPSLRKLMFMGYNHTPKRMRKYVICHGVTFFIIFMIYYNINGGLIPYFLLEPVPEVLGSQSLLVHHFSKTKGDGSKVKWGHATNDRMSLVVAIQDKGVMMLEGDIQLKGQGSSNQQLLPVMVQASNKRTTDDFIFKDWLQVALESNKGIKLDFKTIEPVEICLQQLASVKSKVKKAVHIGANIVEGPNSVKSPYKPVDHNRFIRYVTSNFPESTLVLGWTEESSETSRYTWDMVKQMYNKLASGDIKQPIALSVNAQFIRQSLSQIKWLSEMLDAQLTIYSNENDVINTIDLLFVRNKFPIKSVYYDLHNKLSASFDEKKDNTKLIAREMMQSNLVFQAEQWKAQKTKGSRIYLGTEAVVIQKGLLIHAEDPYVFTNEPVKFKGRVEFFEIPDQLESQKDIGIEIFLHVPNNVNIATISGIKLYIGLDGKILITTQNVKNLENARSQNIQMDGKTHCFSFEIVELVGKNINVRIWQHQNCDKMIWKPTESARLGELMIDVTGIDLQHKHIAVMASNTYGFAAIDSFVISS